MRFILSVCAGWISLADLVLAFQTINNFATSRDVHTKDYQRPKRSPSFPAVVSRRPSFIPNKEEFSICEGLPLPIPDVDGIRRRQLLLSMLYGSTALQAFPVLAKENTPQLDKDIQVDILRPPKDDRDYITYILPNGLRVLLCSDPNSNEAAAAMDVHVGACSDPAEVPGLAHFCEHMLFLGSKPYPKEDAFSTFLASNGGMSNAYTDSEDTVYYFDMEAAETPQRLAKGLQIFGSLFTSPLFTESATGRELNAIESENAKNLQSDSFRVFQLNKARANTHHPYSKFFTGNKKTLQDNLPRSINLRDELIQFYNRYYSANQMTLAVVAPQPMDTLKEMVSKAFSNIPNRNSPKPELAWRGVPPYNNGKSIIPSYQHMLEVVPVQDLRQIALAWPIIYASDQDRDQALLNKQSNYVAHLIGHEGPGSLLSFLKRKGWANVVAASSESELSDFETFEVTVGLTKSGFRAMDQVIEAIFSFISMMKDRAIPDHVFQEVLQVTELEWRFMTKGNVANYVQSLATSMQKYPPPLYVAGPRRLALADPDQGLLADSEPRASFSSQTQLEETKQGVRRYLSNLSLENVLLTVLSKSFQGKTDRTEQWYGTDYSVRPIPPSKLNQWRNCASPKSFQFDFPKPNVFIPSEDGLRIKFPPTPKPRAQTFESRMIPIPPPTIVRDDQRWTVHYRADDRFGQPKAFVVFELLTSQVFATKENAALSNLYEVCVSDRLGEYAYDGTCF